MSLQIVQQRQMVLRRISTLNNIKQQGRKLSDNWGIVYSYIRVMSDGFLLKSTQIKKKSVGQNMNI